MESSLQGAPRRAGSLFRRFLGRPGWKAEPRTAHSPRRPQGSARICQSYARPGVDRKIEINQKRIVELEALFERKLNSYRDKDRLSVQGCQRLSIQSQCLYWFSPFASISNATIRTRSMSRVITLMLDAL
jgi:hypothetical protein